MHRQPLARHRPLVEGHGFELQLGTNASHQVTQDTATIYDLEVVDGGVQFTLTIEDLPQGTKTAKQMIQGGTMIVNTMKAVIETGRPRFGIRLLYVLFRVMGPLTPKRCRSEHWPLTNLNGTAQ